MRSAEALATAQCASCQPRSAAARPPAAGVLGTGSVTVRTVGLGGRAVPAAARPRRRHLRAGRCSASRPKSRTSAARTASGPVAVAGGRAVRAALAGQRGRRRAGQRGGQQRGVRLVLGVRLRVAAALHPLRGDGQRQPRVAGHLGQVLVELPRRVDRVQ